MTGMIEEEVRKETEARKVYHAYESNGGNLGKLIPDNGNGITEALLFFNMLQKIVFLLSFISNAREVFFREFCYKLVTLPSTTIKVLMRPIKCASYDAT